MEEKERAAALEEQWNKLQKVYDHYPVMGKQYVLHAFPEYVLTRLGE